MPACHPVVIFDGHQLPETASLFFGEDVSTSQLLDLCATASSEGVARR